MTLYVLDTDHISLFQKSHPRVVSHVQATDSQNLAVTIISGEEQLRGWFNAIRQANSGERLQWAYLGLRQGIEFFNVIRVLDFDQAALDLHLSMRSAKIRIGTQDLRMPQSFSRLMAHLSPAIGGTSSGFLAWKLRTGYEQQGLVPRSAWNAFPDAPRPSV